MTHQAGSEMPDFRLAGLRIEPRSGEVERDGERVRLEPKVMAVLEALAERAGQLVTKEQLLDTVWPDTIVGDDSLWRCIAELRKLLDGIETPGGRPAIETLPRRGYRLNLRPEPIEPEPIEPEALFRAGRWRRPTPAAAAVGVAVAGALIVLAVLVAAARVPLDPVASAPGVPETAADYRALGMRYYADYDADGIARSLPLLRRAIELDPADAEAHAGLAAALIGRFHWIDRDPEALDEAREVAERAIELDPDSAAAHRALGLARQARGDLDGADEAFRRALELRPDYPHAIANLATVLAERGRLDEAVRLQDGLEGSELPPRIQLANLGAYYAQIGDLAAAKKTLERALAIEPYQPVSSSRMATVEWAEGRTGAAIDRMEAVLEVHPECHSCRELLARIELADGRIRTAADALARFGPGGTPPLLQAAVARAQGEAAEAVEPIVEPVLDAARKQVDSGPPSWRPQLALAAANSLLDRNAEALDALDNARRLGFRDAMWLRVDPLFEPLRDDRRFLGLVDALERDRARLRRRLGA